MTLLITAGVDVGRAGVIRRPPLRGLTAALRTVAGPVTPGWVGWLAVAMALALGTAIARAGGHTGAAVGALQVLPTVGLVLALALLIDQGTAGTGSHAPDNAAAVAAAVALARTLRVAPPANLRVELLLQGAADGGAAGLRQHLRRHRLRAPETIVLGLDTTHAVRLGWWVSDGPLVPLRSFGPLCRQAATAAAQLPVRRAAGIRGRGSTPTLPARLRGIPALTLGADPGDCDAMVGFALLLVDAIDAAVGERLSSGGGSKR